MSESFKEAVNADLAPLFSTLSTNAVDSTNSPSSTQHLRDIDDHIAGITSTEENVSASTSLGGRTDTQEEEKVENQEEKNADGDAVANVVAIHALDIPLPPVSSSPVVIAAAVADAIVTQRYKVVYTGGLWLLSGIETTSDEVRLLNFGDEIDCFPGVIQKAGDR